jgi:hypothetical protein
MSIKHNFTRPFNIEHARAGAPYATRGGEEATILKWNSRHATMPLIGAHSEIDIASSWTLEGRYVVGDDMHHPCDLVMTPLGFIEGKPFFVGDEIIGANGGKPFIAEPRDKDGDLEKWAWPKPVLQHNPARDMAIAEAVRAECLRRFQSLSTPAATSIAQMNLATIIHGVA